MNFCVFHVLILIFAVTAGLQSVYAAPASCEVFFSPKDQLARRLIELIDQEKKSIKVAVYSITHREIAEALVKAKQRGVQVEVIVDPFAVKKRSSIHMLLKGQVPLFIWDHELRTGGKQKRLRPLMHDKFCIFGDDLTWTGSFNFTYHASNLSQENAVTLESREIASKYLDQFCQMKLYESRPYQEYIAYHPKKGKKT